MYITISLLIVVIIMVISISKWKVNPFLAILSASFILAILIKIPLLEIPNIISDSFASTFGSIGLIIIFGALIGVMLEESGAALKISDMLIKALGERYPKLTMMLIGWIVSIPVFCDSGFILLTPISKSLGSRTGVSKLQMSVALSAGLYAAHTLIPPTPGVVGATGLMGMESNLILIFIVGGIVSIFALIPSYIFTYFIGNKSENKLKEESTKEEYEKLIDSYPKLPNGFVALLPIVLPILLMAIGTIGKIIFKEGVILNISLFIGKPVIAIIIGFITSLFLPKNKNSREVIINNTLKSVAPILFITAAGGVLGKVIIYSGFIDIIKNNSSTLIHLGFFFPFLIAAFIKSAQGSSTVAMITTASIMGIFQDSQSVISTLGFDTPFLAALIIASIGAGSMVVSHANDSYFWVVTGFTDISTKDGYRSQTIMSLINGIGALVGVYVLYGIWIVVHPQ